MEFYLTLYHDIFPMIFKIILNILLLLLLFFVWERIVSILGQPQIPYVVKDNIDPCLLSAGIKAYSPLPGCLNTISNNQYLTIAILS